MKLITILATSALLLGGCATQESVTSTAVTSGLELEKIDNFAVTVTDTSSTDTAFSSDMQRWASSELIDELEDNGFDYVGERNPQIRFILRTYPSVEASYLNVSAPEEVVITKTEEVREPDGTITRSSEVRSVKSVQGSDPIYMPANSRIIILDVYDTNSEVLLWRGYLSDDDTSLNEEKLEAALEELVERLEEET